MALRQVISFLGLVSLTLFLSDPGMARGSARDDAELRVGIRAGLSIAQYGANAIADTRAGLCAGLFLRRNLPHSFQIQLEALYARKGGRNVYVGWAPILESDEMINLYARSWQNYLEIPLLMKYFPVRGDSYVLAGPAFGILLSEETVFAEDYDFSKFGGANDPTGTSGLSTILSSTAGTNTSFVVGLGHAFALGQTLFSLDMRYQWGLQDINKGDPVLRINALSLTIGLAP